MAWQRWLATRGLRLSSPHTCWRTWNGGERTIILCVLMHRCGWRSCNHENEGANVWHNATGSELQPWQPEELTDDGRRARCSLTHCHRFSLESHSSQVRLQCHGVEWRVKGSAEEVEWASLQAEVAYPGCLRAKNQLEVYLQRVIDLSTMSYGSTGEHPGGHWRV